MTQPFFASTISAQSRNNEFLTIKTVVRKTHQNNGHTGSSCLDKAVLAQGRGGGGGLRDLCGNGCPLVLKLLDGSRCGVLGDCKGGGWRYSFLLSDPGGVFFMHGENGVVWQINSRKKCGCGACADYPPAPMTNLHCAFVASSTVELVGRQPCSACHPSQQGQNSAKLHTAT